MSNAWQRLQESLYFFRQHWRMLAAILLPVVIPVMALKHYRIWSVLEGNMQAVQQDQLLFMAGQLLWLFTTAATILYVVAVTDNQPATASAIRREAVLRIPGLFLVHVAVTFAVLGGLLLLVIPGLWLLGCLMPAYVLVVAEKQGIFDALQQSFQRFRPHAWQLLLTLLTGVLLLLAVLSAFLLLSSLVVSLRDSASVALKVVTGTLMDAVVILCLQLVPVLLVRFYDLEREGRVQE